MKEKQDLAIIFKPVPIVGSYKRLIVSNEFIESSKIGKESKNSIRLNKKEIVAYRFGINWITGYQFTIGRNYKIFIKDSSDRVIEISFKSLYGYKKTELNRNFNEIIQSIWNFYFTDLTDEYIEEVSAGRVINICGVAITDQGITLETKNLLNKKRFPIPWKSVGTKDYYTYYAIFSVENPSDIHVGYNYLDEWNVGILYSVIETLKKHYCEPIHPGIESSKI